MRGASIVSICILELSGMGVVDIVLEEEIGAGAIDVKIALAVREWLIISLMTKVGSSLSSIGERLM